MRKIPVIDSEEMQIAIQQEIHRSEESRYDHKLHGVLLVANGYDSYKVVDMFGQDPTTVQRWVKRFNESGFAGLRDGERPGRPKLLTEKQWKELSADLQKSPASFNYPHSIWDGKLMSLHLKREFKVEIGIRQCQRIFKQLGFRLRKPRPVIANADPVAHKI